MKIVLVVNVVVSKYKRKENLINPINKYIYFYVKQVFELIVI